jgi:hypothetical protein
VKHDEIKKHDAVTGLQQYAAKTGQAASELGKLAAEARSHAEGYAVVHDRVAEAARAAEQLPDEAYADPKSMPQLTAIRSLIQGELATAIGRRSHRSDFRGGSAW